MTVRIYDRNTKESKDFKDVCSILEEPSGKYLTLVFLDGGQESFKWSSVAVIHVKEGKQNG